MGNKLTKSILVVLAFFLLCGWKILLPVPMAIAMEEEIEEFIPSAFMVIEAKSRHSIVASKRQFEIMGETQILNRRGNEIRIQDLPVPCQAQVDYETAPYSNPIALKIRIKKVFPGASTDWSDLLPE